MNKRGKDEFINVILRDEGRGWGGRDWSESPIWTKKGNNDSLIQDLLVWGERGIGNWQSRSTVRLKNKVSYINLCCNLSLNQLLILYILYWECGVLHTDMKSLLYNILWNRSVRDSAYPKVTYNQGGNRSCLR